MFNVMDLMRNDIKNKIIEAISSVEVLCECGMDDVSKIHLEVPKDPSMGDFATTIALSLAKQAKTNPRTLADEIASSISSKIENVNKEKLGSSLYIDKVEVAGPGFINFRLNSRWVAETLLAVEKLGSKYGHTDFGKGEKILVEFVSANPTGPLNVVNARAAAVGDALVKLLDAAGFCAKSEFYINDAGNQVDILGDSVYARYMQFTDENFSFPENGYMGDYVIEVAKEIKNKYESQILTLFEDEARVFFKEASLNMIKEWQKKSLLEYGVTFDRWASEKELRDSGAVEKLIEDMKTLKVTYESEGATWFRSTQFGDDKDRVLVKNDGLYTYVAPDLAYHLDKIKRGFTKLIDILGPDHHGYQARMKAGLTAFSNPVDTLEVILLQFVTLMHEGQPVKMSKRAGDFITMDELMRDVPKDAARYFFIMRNTSSHLDFDIVLAKATTMDNPVWYIQYAHARACSILRQADAASINESKWSKPDLSLLTEEAEIKLVKKMAVLPDALIEASIQRAPSQIARYAYELASEFHSFYNDCRVVGLDSAELMYARLFLVKQAQVVISNVLTIMGLSSPERM